MFGIDAKLQLLPQDDADALSEDFAAIIDKRLERIAGKSK